MAVAGAPSFTVEWVGPRALETSAGPVSRAGLVARVQGRQVSWQVVSPGDRATLRGKTLVLEPRLEARPFLDARYEHLLLGGTGSGLSLALPETADLRLNGEAAKVADLPRGKAAFVRWDADTGRVGRLEVVDPLAVRAASPGTGDLWSVRLLTPGPLTAGQAVDVELKAPSQGEAFFDVAGVAWDVPAREVSPGVYRGSLPVVPGLDARNTYVLGRYRRDGVEYPVRVGPSLSLAPTPPQVHTFGPTTVWTGGPIYAELSSAGTLIDASATRLAVDGVDVTSRAERTVDLIVYWPDELAPGSHIVDLAVADLAGNVTHKRWTFSSPERPTPQRR